MWNSNKQMRNLGTGESTNLIAFLMLFLLLGELIVFRSGDGFVFLLARSSIMLKNCECNTVWIFFIEVYLYMIGIQ